MRKNSHLEHFSALNSLFPELGGRHRSGIFLLSMSVLRLSPAAHPVQQQSGRHPRRPRGRHPPPTVARAQRAQHARLRCKWPILNRLVEDDVFQSAENILFLVWLQVSIYLPPLKTMKNIIDRMKNLSNFLVGSQFIQHVTTEKKDKVLKVCVCV